MSIDIDSIKKVLDKQQIKYSYIGDSDVVIEGFSACNNYKKNTVTWIGRQEMARKYDIVADLIVLEKGLTVSNCHNIFVCENSKKAFFSIVEEFFDNSNTLPRRGTGTVIGSNVKIGKHVSIGHNCTIEGDVTIGDNTILYHNVTIVNSVKIGKNCVIQSGVRVGHDGFGYAENSDGTKVMIKHHGGVIIEDNVFLGSNTEVARGTIDDTIIGAGSKIDSLTHIAHNVKLGKNNGIVAGTTIYGSVETGDNCYIATSVIRDQVKLGNNVFVGMNSTVTHSFPNDCLLVGSPAKEIKR